MTGTPDPMAQRDETREALADPAYIAAYDLAMVGRQGEWDDDQRTAVELARTLTGDHGAGLPAPLRPGGAR